MSLRTNNGKDFYLKSKDVTRYLTLLSLSTGPGGKKDPRRDGFGKETVWRREW